MSSGRITIDGIKELQASLKEVDGELQKQLRVVFNEAAQMVVDTAQAQIPKKSGKAARSVKAQSQQRKVIVKAGGKRVPYYGWLDFGGAVGRNKSIKRAFLKDGRYIYPAYYKNRDEILKHIEEGLTDLVKKAGLDING